MMFIIWLPVLIALGLSIVWMARPGQAGGCCGGSHAAQAPSGPSSAQDGALGIARQRLARGEITSAEFEEICRVLQN